VSDLAGAIQVHLLHRGLEPGGWCSVDSMSGPGFGAVVARMIKIDVVCVGPAQAF